MALLLFEVMDKEPTLTYVVVTRAAAIFLTMLLVRWKRWLAIPMLLVAGALAFAVWDEITDPFVGPAIRREAGLTYVVVAYASCALLLLTPIVAAFFPKTMNRSTHG